MKLKIRRPVWFEATVQEMSAEDVRSKIGNGEYERIKREDPHPMFVDLKVAKQGSSYGPIIIGGIKKTIEKLWGAPRIQELTRWLNRKVPIVFRHGDTNDLEGRPSVGRTIVGWNEQDSDGSLVARGIAYVSSKFAQIQEMIRSKVIDACSIEAQLRFGIGGASQLVVDKVLGLSAVTLCRTGVDGTPGFAGATIVGAVQEMAKLKDALDAAGIRFDDVDIVVSDDDDRGKDKGSRKPDRERRRRVEDLTISEVKAFLDQTGAQPDRIFPIEQLLKVPAVKDAIENEVKERMVRVAADKDDKMADLEQQIADKDKEIKDRDAKIDNLGKEITPYKDQVRRGKIQELVKGSEMLKNAPKEKAEYVAKHVASVIPTDADLSTDHGGQEIEKAIKAQLQEIKEFGIDFGGGTPTGSGGGKSTEEEEDFRGGSGGGGSTGIKPKGELAKEAETAFKSGINLLDPDAGKQKEKK